MHIFENYILVYLIFETFPTNPGIRLVVQYKTEIIFQRGFCSLFTAIRLLQGMFVLLGNEICITIINMKLINPSILTSSEYKIDWLKTFHLYHLPPVFDMHPKRSQAPQGNDKTITSSPPILVYPLQAKINPLAKTFIIYICFL